MAASVAAAAPDVPPAPPVSITLLFGGDVTLGFHFEEHFDAQQAQGASRSEMVRYAFANVQAALKGVDLFVVNLECPFTERGEKMAKNFNFRARPELVEVLSEGRVGAASLANNHLMDYGPAGIEDTQLALKASGIAFFGAGSNLVEARKPAVIERGGVRVALLGYLFLGESSIEPPAMYATDAAPGVAGHPSDVSKVEAMLREDIPKALSSADVVIPFFHWGKEGEHTPKDYQVQLARIAIDLGASAVVGAHPHVLQGAELYRGKPILYSLGNFVFGGNWNPRKKAAALFRARFSKEGYLSGEVLPIQTDRYPEFPMQPFLLSGEKADQILSQLAGYSSGFEVPLLRRCTRGCP